MKRKPRSPGYVVVDVETTGLRTSEDDRIIEIGLVHLDATGDVTGEWTTLVNPGRDLGPEHVHGITEADVSRAPAFQEIAGGVAALLRGRIMAAHNLPFDARFVAHEFRRLDVNWPVDHRLGVCTMNWAAHFLPGDPRSLADCCAVAGVPLDGAHEAMSDARAAAGLLRHYIESAGPDLPWRYLFEAVARITWPDVPGQRTLPPSLMLPPSL
ncbi:3'-5' exonuclease [Sphaerisporangium corydalis]|uniref:Exonuclease domain-containing protein n=1 Tax=Sphaerisporangium corydalis TaxID=1441875 RepID=A0ABV9EFW4_9ACTN|nr:3'-5' exonuclease [Sphaerisporangium corydalis]